MKIFNGTQTVQEHLKQEECRLRKKRMMQDYATICATKLFDCFEQEKVLVLTYLSKLMEATFKKYLCCWTSIIEDLHKVYQESCGI
jgi:hypothetical protein